MKSFVTAVAAASLAGYSGVSAVKLGSRSFFRSAKPAAAAAAGKEAEADSFESVAMLKDGEWPQSEDANVQTIKAIARARHGFDRVNGDMTDFIQYFGEPDHGTDPGFEYCDNVRDRGATPGDVRYHKRQCRGFTAATRPAKFDAQCRAIGACADDGFKCTATDEIEFRSVSAPSRGTVWSAAAERAYALGAFKYNVPWKVQYEWSEAKGREVLVSEGRCSPTLSDKEVFQKDFKPQRPPVAKPGVPTPPQQPVVPQQPKQPSQPVMPWKVDESEAPVVGFGRRAKRRNVVYYSVRRNA